VTVNVLNFSEEERMKKRNRWCWGFLTCAVAISGCVDIPTSIRHDADPVLQSVVTYPDSEEEDIGALDATAQGDSTATRQPGGFGSGH
jgi:hypothetical protein